MLISHGGQVPNGANAKQSAAKILFNQQLQSVPEEKNFHIRAIQIVGVPILRFD